MRYEHVKFDYLANGQKKEDQSKGYNNLFLAVAVNKNQRLAAFHELHPQDATAQLC